jgi:hypothetical protein
MGESVLSKILTEVGVKMATPWGWMRVEIPRRVRQGRVGQEIGRDGRGFVGKEQFAGEVGRSSHEQDRSQITDHRSVRKGEGDDRQRFGSEERA